MQIIRLS